MDRFLPLPAEAFTFLFDAVFFFFVLLLEVAFVLVFLGRFGFAYSGSFALPVSRFHSSKVSGEISPFTKSSANFLRCALLLNGMMVVRPLTANYVLHPGKSTGQAYVLIRVAVFQAPGFRRIATLR